MASEIGNRLPVIQEIERRVLELLDEMSQEMEFSTGEAMNALFAVMANSAQASPNYDPQVFARETANAVRIATGLQ
jgi:hypothetical protein